MNEFFASLHEPLQLTHIVLFAVLLISPKWRMTAAPLFIAAVFYYFNDVELVDMLGYKVLIVRAGIDLVSGWIIFWGGANAYLKQATLLCILTLTHLMVLLEHYVFGGEIFYNSYMWVAIGITILQALFALRGLKDVGKIIDTWRVGFGSRSLLWSRKIRVEFMQKIPHGSEK